MKHALRFVVEHSLVVPFGAAIALVWANWSAEGYFRFASGLAFAVNDVGMALFFAPVANVVLSSVRPEEEGQASGANNAIRELGGVFGVAVLASVFSHYGGYGTGATFVNGLTPAVYVGAVVVAVGGLAALAISRRPKQGEALALEPALENAA